MLVNLIGLQRTALQRSIAARVVLEAKPRSSVSRGENREAKAAIATATAIEGGAAIENIIVEHGDDASCWLKLAIKQHQIAGMAR